MKKLLAYLFRYPLVYTQDMDGEIRLRIPRKTVFNNYVVNGIDGHPKGILQSNGEVMNGSYIKKWKPANKKGEDLLFLLKMEN